jgi:hypothetical protein
MAQCYREASTDIGKLARTSKLSFYIKYADNHVFLRDPELSEYSDAIRHLASRLVPRIAVGKHSSTTSIPLSYPSFRHPPSRGTTFEVPCHNKYTFWGLLTLGKVMLPVLASYPPNSPWAPDFSKLKSIFLIYFLVCLASLGLNWWNLP